MLSTTSSVFISYILSVKLSFNSSYFQAALVTILVAFNCPPSSFFIFESLNFIVAYLNLRSMASRRRYSFILDGSMESSEVSQFEYSRLLVFSESLYSITIVH